jgi:WD40 repeat protein
MRWAIVPSLVLLLILSASLRAETRKWTARTGNFSVEAELIDVTGDKVVLKKADGMMVTVPLERLSLADVRHVQHVLRDATAAVGALSGTRSPTESKEKDESAAAPSATGSEPGGGPPLAEPNAARWQVYPDPSRSGGFSSRQIRDFSVSLPERFGSGAVIYPAVPSPFVGHVDGSGKSTIHVWDLRSGNRRGPLTIDMPSGRAIALSPDGELVASAETGKPKIQIWPLAGKRPQREIDLEERFPSIQIMKFVTPTRLLFVTTTSNALHVFDIKTGKEVIKIGVESLHDPKQLAISPGGHYAACVTGFNKPVQIFDLRNGEAAGELTLGDSSTGLTQLAGLRFSADGEELAALTEGQGSELICWSMKSGKEVARHTFNRSLHQLVDNSSSYYGCPIDFIPGNKGWLLFGRAIIDREKGGPIWVGKANLTEQQVQRLVIDEQRILQLSGDHNNRKLVITRLPWDEINKSAAIVASGGTAADAALPPITKANLAAAKTMVLQPDLLPWKAGMDAAAPAGVLRSEPIPLPVQAYKVHRLLFAGPDVGKVLTAVHANKPGESSFPPKIEMQRFDLKTGRQDASIAPNFGAELRDFSLDGSRLAVSSSGHERIDVYEIENGKHVVGFRPYQSLKPPSNTVTWAAFLDKDRLLTLNGLGQLVLWSLPDCRAAYSMKVTGGHLLPLSPTRKYGLARHEGDLQAFELATGEPLGTLERSELGDEGTLLAHEFRPDGKMLVGAVVGEHRKLLVCWDLGTGKVLKQFDFDGASDITWAGDERVLVHAPIDMRPIGFVSSELPPLRFNLLEVATGRTLWRYQLPEGKVSSQAVDGRVWYVASRELSSSARLVGIELPSAETAAVLESAPAPENLLPKGAKVTLVLDVEISGNPIADKILADDVRSKLTDHLARRGLKVEERSPLAFKVALKERFTGDVVELRPILGGVRARYEVRGIQLACKLELSDISGRTLWSRSNVIPVRKELPRAGIPANVDPADYVRQQQWSSALDWLMKSAIPAELYESWAYAGLGESVLTPTGEVRLTLDLPPKASVRR